VIAAGVRRRIYYGVREGAGPIERSIASLPSRRIMYYPSRHHLLSCDAAVEPDDSSNRGLQDVATGGTICRIL
jgi:hypothetical protein